MYCLSRDSTEKIAAFLTDNGIPALPYHAGLDAGTRAEHQARFLREAGTGGLWLRSPREVMLRAATPRLSNQAPCQFGARDLSC